MPGLKSARIASSIMTNGAKTIGQIHKENSDFVMEQTFFDDIQSRVCFIYDYFHDNFPELNEGMQYDENTIATRIDAKFIVSSYGSIDKDQVAYHLMFRPSQKINFVDGDDLYYYEKDYRQKYGIRFPIGMYVAIPDDTGKYVRWLICDFEEGNQFIKYQILPCDYRFQWISVEGNKRIKRQVWGCTRAMNSYTSGLWVDRYFEMPNDVAKAILPLNSITENINYVGENGSNQRMIVSAKVKYPLVWKVSKLENTKPIGLYKMTFTQDIFNNNTDYIEYDETGNIISMWADYYSPDQSIPIDDETPLPPIADVSCKLDCIYNSIKINGSYRTIEAKYYDKDYNDVSEQRIESEHEWKFYVKDGDSETELDESLYEIKYETNKNIIKMRLFNARQYINKSLLIKCKTDGFIFGETSIGILN